MRVVNGPKRKKVDSMSKFHIVVVDAQTAKKCTLRF